MTGAKGRKAGDDPLLLYGRGLSLEGPQLDWLRWPRRVLTRVTGINGTLLIS